MIYIIYHSGLSGDIFKSEVDGSLRVRRDAVNPNKSLSLQSIQAEIFNNVVAFAQAICSIRTKACPRGRTGRPGTKGAKGDKGGGGSKGNPGKHGPRGIVGPRGTVGPKGIVGPPGASGEKGEKGNEGPQGMPGPRGKPGQSASAPDVIISPPNSVRVNETTTVDIYCSSKSNPPARITWRKVNGSLEDERIDVNPSGRLRISGVRDEDRGKYECTAQNVLGVARSFVTLVVNGKVARHCYGYLTLIVILIFWLLLQ